MTRNTNIKIEQNGNFSDLTLTLINYYDDVKVKKYKVPKYSSDSYKMPNGVNIGVNAIGGSIVNITIPQDNSDDILSYIIQGNNITIILASVQHGSYYGYSNSNNPFSDFIGGNEI